MSFVARGGLTAKHPLIHVPTLAASRPRSPTAAHNHALHSGALAATHTRPQTSAKARGSGPLPRKDVPITSATHTDTRNPHRRGIGKPAHGAMTQAKQYPPHQPNKSDPTHPHRPATFPTAPREQPTPFVLPTVKHAHFPHGRLITERVVACSDATDSNNTSHTHQAQNSFHPPQSNQQLRNTCRTNLGSRTPTVKRARPPSLTPPMDAPKPTYHLLLPQAQPTHLPNVHCHPSKSTTTTHPPHLSQQTHLVKSRGMHASGSGAVTLLCVRFDSLTDRATKCTTAPW